MVRISVIIPIYNMEKYLKECLDSVLKQTLQDIEVIAINDGSTDCSLDILHDYSEKDKRIQIIDKENAGVGAARNDGIKRAGGEYVSFIDPDDKYASENALLHCYESAVKEHVLIAGGRLQYLNERGELKNEEKRVIGLVSIPDSGLMNYEDYQFDYGYWCFIYNRKMLIDNNIFFPLYSRFQDPPFFVKAMITADKLSILDEPVYIYRNLYGSSKFTFDKTMDFLQGIMDNLVISREHNLEKLHYITAHRLDKEGSFMITKNLFDERRDELLASLIKASSLVDDEWLRDKGYSDIFPFVPEVFKYLTDTTEKYERLRSNKLLHGVSDALKYFRK